MGSGEENQIPVIDRQDQLPVLHNPEKVLELAQRAAAALKDVMKKKDKPVIINGEQYLEYEDLQLLGQFYGCTVKTYDAERVELEGIEGAKAKADLLDTIGRVIGGAEAYCFRNEEKGDTKPWEDKPWFQVASMAQTRAGAKAFRNRLAWVVVLAGYRPTPAEEMEATGGKERPYALAAQDAKPAPAFEPNEPYRGILAEYRPSGQKKPMLLAVQVDDGSLLKIGGWEPKDLAPSMITNMVGHRVDVTYWMSGKYVNLGSLVLVDELAPASRTKLVTKFMGELDAAMNEPMATALYKATIILASNEDEQKDIEGSYRLRLSELKGI